MASLDSALEALRATAPDAPFLALGQTIFWDEPVKATVASLARRRFVAGVHDTDYFAKLPSGPRRPGEFRILPHNDTTTRGLWSAAAEFSTLFGSETVVTREALGAAGFRLDTLDERGLDEATEAWGWRGIVSLDEDPPLTLEVPTDALRPELLRALDWAFGETLACLPGDDGALAAELRARVETAGAECLADLYEALVPGMYAFGGGEPVAVETTRTSDLLRFNRETCGLARFDLPRLFVEANTRPLARAFYDEALRSPDGSGGGQYALARFGTGAIPFDLVIPGHGRGVVRLGTRGAVIETRTPQFLSFKRPIATLEEFAGAVEDKFGPECALIGKAVTLIGMLAAEHAFVFHEGASGYVDASVRLHNRLCGELLWCTALNPILRVRYRTWDSLSTVDRELRLPEPLRRPFGCETIAAREFAARWREVGEASRALLAHLGTLRSPADLLAYLAEGDPSWLGRLRRYRELGAEADRLGGRVTELEAERRTLYGRRRELKARRAAHDLALGEHFRAEISGHEPSPEALAAREAMLGEREALAREAREAEDLIRELLRGQREAARDPAIEAARAERRAIAGEAERARLVLIREAILASDGLEHADARPSAWWLRFVSPDGAWFAEMRRTAEARLERLRPDGPR